MGRTYINKVKGLSLFMYLLGCDIYGGSLVYEPVFMVTY